MSDEDKKYYQAQFNELKKQPLLFFVWAIMSILMIIAIILPFIDY